MKLTGLLLLFTLLFSNAQAQVSNPDTMVHRIFSVLQAKDEKAFVALYPNSQQMGRLMRKMMGGIKEVLQQEMAKAGNDSGAGKLNFDSLISAQIGTFDDPAKYKEMEEQFAKEYQQIMTKSAAKGVDWSKAVLVKYTIDTAAVTDEAMGNLFGNGDFKAMKGVIDFTVKDSAYQLAFDKVMYLPEEKGWFGMGFKQLARKGESLEPDVAEEEMDSDVPGVDMPPPPAPKKPAAKKPVKGKTPIKKKGKA